MNNINEKIFLKKLLTTEWRCDTITTSTKRNNINEI